MYGFILDFNITGGELKTLIYRLAKNFKKRNKYGIWNCCQKCLQVDVLKLSTNSYLSK